MASQLPRKRRSVCRSCKKHKKWCEKVLKRRKLWQVLRQAQRTSGCTTTTITTVAKAVAPLLDNGSDSDSDEDEPASSQHRVADSEIMEAAEAVKLTLHGCIGCNNYVFVPRSARVSCPKCGHDRFNAKNKPNEV